MGPRAQNIVARVNFIFNFLKHMVVNEPNANSVLNLPYTAFIRTRLGSVTYVTFWPLSPIYVATPGIQIKIGIINIIKDISFIKYSSLV
jgi:hypothetical protein